jgi:hypothetical protein
MLLEVADPSVEALDREELGRRLELLLPPDAGRRRTPASNTARTNRGLRSYFGVSL